VPGGYARTAPYGDRGVGLVAWKGSPGHREREQCPEGNNRHKNGLDRALTQFPDTHATYKHLLERQPKAYHTHLQWVDEFRPEEIRLAMLSVRRSGAGRADQFLEALKEAQCRLRESEK
jgi:hypothetical protein